MTIYQPNQVRSLQSFQRNFLSVTHDEKNKQTKQNKTETIHHSHYHTEHKIDVRLTAKEEKLENKSIQCNMFSLTIVMIIT